MGMTTTASYFRVQTADRDVNELLDPGYQYSSTYNRSTTLRGVSTCPSIDDLAEYLASGQATAIQPRTGGTWVIVELTGELSLDGAIDAGEVLIIPTAIVSVRPVDDDFMDLIAAKDLFLASFDTSANLWED